MPNIEILESQII